MNNVDMKKMFIRTCVLSAAAFAVMFYRVATTGIVLSDASVSQIQTEDLEAQKALEADYTQLSKEYDRVVMIELENLGEGLETAEGEEPLLEDAGYLIAKELMLLCEMDENAAFKLYFPNLHGEDISGAKRRELMEESGTDLYVKIGAAISSDTSDAGVVTEYNEKLFLRSLGTAEFSDILERHLAVSTGKKAVGIVPTQDEAVLSCMVPAARLCVGYTTNAEDVNSLQDAGYIKAVALGIYQAVMDAFDAMK